MLESRFKIHDDDHSSECLPPKIAVRPCNLRQAFDAEIQPFFDCDYSVSILVELSDQLLHCHLVNLLRSNALHRVFKLGYRQDTVTIHIKGGEGNT